MSAVEPTGDRSTLQRIALPEIALPHATRLSVRPDARDWLPQRGARLAAFSWVAARFPEIGPCLDAAAIVPIELSVGRLDGVVGWGGGLPAQLARRYAEMRALPFWTLEDGFLRSAGLGKQGAASVSLIADDLGVHFMPTGPSRLEQALNRIPDDRALARAARLRDRIVRERLTKYNHLPDRPPAIPKSARRRILLVDQVQGDRSAGPPQLASALFQRMWREAQWQSDAPQIVVRSHPDVMAGKAVGHLAPLVGSSAHWIDDRVNVHAVLDCVDEVWTVSSQLGMDALLRGIPVVTFGMPAYAGWGLSEDRAQGDWALAARARRRSLPSVDAFVAAAFLDYPIYFDPVTRQRTDAEGAVERLISLRHHALERQGHYLVSGLSRHKHATLRRFVEGPWSTVSFTGTRASRARLAKADHVLVWGNGARPAHANPDRIMRVEDGFIRSAGLGAALVPPASLCFGRSALHSDATRASDLETLLNTAVFDAELLKRAHRLRSRLLQLAITKYNLAGGPAPDYAGLAAGRPIVIVPGQVPGDSSLSLGLAVHRSNVDLLAAVRAERPDAFLIYKEHPDLVSGLRPGATPRMVLERCADLVVGDVPVCSLLNAADEVHVATSQFGFEAILRGRPTVCHGAPFYAGWGLTVQRREVPRPRRKLTLDQLVAGALILYPRYLSSVSHLPCEVEDVVEELARSRARPAHASNSRMRSA